MKKIKAVIFDMDGVIFDTERIYLKTWQSVFNKYGYEITKELYVTVMGKGRKNVKNVFLKAYGQKLPIEIMYQEKDDELAKELEKELPIKSGVLELLEFLNENGYKVALATSSKRDRTMRNLGQASLFDKFNEIVCGDEIVNLKPNPEIFLKAAAKLEVIPEECIVIEDSPAGLEAGKRAGMMVINVPDLKYPDDEMRRNSNKIFKSLYEVKEFVKGVS